MPRGPLDFVPRPFLSEQGILGLSVWDEEITKSQADKGDLDVISTNIITGDQTKIRFNHNRLSLADMNKYSNDVGLVDSSSWIEGVNAIMGRGPSNIFRETFINIRLTVIYNSRRLSKKDVESVQSEYTHTLSVSKRGGQVFASTHVMSIEQANDIKNELGITEDQMMFQGVLVEEEDEMFVGT